MSVDKLVDSTQLDSDLTSVANAIRTKSGGSGQLVFPSGFVSAIGDIPSGGYTLADSIEREYTGDVVYNGTGKIPVFFFVFCTKMTSFSAPNVTIIDGRTSRGYSGNNDSHIFEGCTNLESVNLPSVRSFYYAGQIFYGCKKITTWGIDWHKITQLGGSAFRNCSVPEAIAFVGLTTGETYNDTFNGSSTLKKVDFDYLTKIGTTVFNNTGLDTFVIRHSSVPTLSNINAFANTPFASGGSGGTLYVPNSLISSYQSASNWSTIIGYTNNRIKSIESTHTDPNAEIDLTTHYVDGTEIPSS